MAVWRERARELFPELRRELGDETAIFSINALWFELLPMAQNAHSAGDEDLLGRIYGFAAWCFGQGGEVLRNAVAVSFYEHLFDEPWLRPLVAGRSSDGVPWLSEQVVRGCWELWEARLSAEDLEEVARLTGKRNRSGSG